MNYLFWDTERIRNTKIYMSAIVLTDSSFSILKQELAIDNSIDVSKRHSPRRKIELLRDKAIVFNNFTELADWLVEYINESVVICFGKDDFVALNDQLKIHNLPIVQGEFYDLQLAAKTYALDSLSNLGSVAAFLNEEHDAHNPLSDSYVTMQFFKYLKERHNIETIKKAIPNKVKILDIEVNGSIY